MVDRPFGRRYKKIDSVPIPPAARENSPRFLAGQVNSYDYSSGVKTIPVIVPLVASMTICILAYGLSSGNETTRGCVDQSGVVVPDKECEEEERNTHSYHPYPHRWHYGGTYRLGAPYSGGSYTKPVSSSTNRGLFGGTGHHFGFGIS